MSKCRDHLGKEYTSINEMCKAYGISLRLYDGRLRLGWSVKDALTKEVGVHKKECEDHLGNKYSSVSEMCTAYGITSNRYRARKRHGYSLKDALTAKREVKDHLGNTYESDAEMCRAYGIDRKAYWWRRDNGWSLEDALTKPKYMPSKSRKYKDHLGKEYDSIKEMCKAYGISSSAYRRRRAKGWSLADALEKPVETKSCGGRGACISKKCTDHLGKEYNSITGMCEAYGITIGLYRNRIMAGWSLEDTLTKPVYDGMEVKDHNGNTFKTKAEMCRHYGILQATYDSRIKRGLSLEEALGLKAGGGSE